VLGIKSVCAVNGFVGELNIVDRRLDDVAECVLVEPVGVWELVFLDEVLKVE
jgi:hypothetical protein